MPSFSALARLVALVQLSTLLGCAVATEMPDPEDDAAGGRRDVDRTGVDAHSDAPSPDGDDDARPADGGDIVDTGDAEADTAVDTSADSINDTTADAGDAPDDVAPDTADDAVGSDAADAMGDVPIDAGTDAAPDVPLDVAPDTAADVPDLPDTTDAGGPDVPPPLRADIDTDGDHVGDAHDLDPFDPTVGLPSVAVADRVVLRVAAPPSTPDGAVVHVAGDFNGWTHAPMTQLTDGTWMLAIAPPAGAIRYKFTLGEWTREEGDFRGVGNDRRLDSIAAGRVVGHHVRYWAPDPAPAASITGRVDVIADVGMPSIGRSGTIRVYTPPGYDTSGRHYPVLYMHDGQNVFDATTAAFGAEWGADEAATIAMLEEAVPGLIVVAIDNGPARSCEYGPFPNSSGCDSGPGLADEYADTIVGVIKPLVDSRYRTLPSRRNTGVAGSSRGGTATIVAAVHRNDVFSIVGAFSATALTDVLAGDLASWVRERPRTEPSRWHFDYGDAELVLGRTAAEMIAALDPVIQVVRDSDPDGDVVRRVIVPGAVHTEAAWAARFGESLRWLYGTPVP